MIADPKGREILGGGGAIAVDVSAIGRELRRLWQDATDPDRPTSAGAPVITRACTRNLIVLAANAEEAGRATRLVAGMAGRHPTRTFVVEASAQGDPDRLEAHLQAHCALRGGGRHVCCEQISLAVGPRARRRAAGAIMPLLVPDLPVFVWSVGAPSWDDELLVRLLDVTDRLVVDSRTSEDATALMLELAAEERADRWVPGDFEWSRLAPWREAIAGLFDTPSTAGLPALLERVVVRHAQTGSPVGAALLAGWMLDRLGAARGEAAPAATAALEPVAGMAAGDVLAVTLTARTPEARCEIVLAHGEAALIARVDLADSCALPSRSPRVVPADEHLLEDQLDEAGAWPLYERALERAVRLLAGDSLA